MNALTKTENHALAINDAELVKVLQTSLYPGAAIESIKMVLGYCKAAGLDPMQKPVHIVPMWDSKSGAMRDVVMPGVNLYRTQAMRSGSCAGVSEPEFGPDVTENIGGHNITYPSWCRVTIKRRLPTGEIVEFTAREFWRENYAIKGGKEKSVAPNAMWTKRPYGQIAKCAEAQALRKAFPEIASQPTADEMEGKAMRADEAPAPEFDYLDPQPILEGVFECKTDAEAAAYWKLHNAKFAHQPADHGALKQAVIAHRQHLAAASVKLAPKTFDEVMAMICGAFTEDELNACGPFIDALPVEDVRVLNAKYEEVMAAIKEAA